MSPVRTDHAGPSTSFPISSSSSSIPVKAQDEAARIKMEAFRKVKPTCVALLSQASSPPTLTSPHSRLLSTLLTLVNDLPPSAFTQSMINYLLFPLTQILRSARSTPLPENFLEAAFRFLAYIVTRWKSAEGGIDVLAWEQLWRFAIASVARTQIHGKGKGKEKEPGTEVHLEAVNLLSALLAPDSDASGSITYPNIPMRKGWSTPKSPLMSSLFQTISYLLSQISPSPPHRQLQLSSLRLLRPLISYLRGQYPVLASLLPGIVSGVVKLVSAEGRGMKGDVGAAASGLVEDIIRLTLNDNGLMELGVLRGKVDDLSQLADDWDGQKEALDETHPPPSSPAPSTSSTTAGKLDPFPPLTKSYLTFTSSQLCTAIPQILSTLSDHPSDTCRNAAIDLACSVLEFSHESLPTLIPSSTRTLLLLSRDTFDPVRHRAQLRLISLLGIPGLDLGLVDILSSAINSLPRLITSSQDDKIIHESKVISAIAEIIQSSLLGSRGNAIESLLGSGGKVERWGWALLDCLEFGRPGGWSKGDPAGRAAALGWIQVGMTSSSPIGLLGASTPPSLESEDPVLAEFPHLPFRYLESPITAKAISRMLEQVGRAGGEGVLHSVEHFLQFAKNHRSNGIARAVPALWCAQRLLDGIARGQIEGAEGRVGKRTRKMAKEIVRIVTALDEEEDDDDDEGDIGVVQTDDKETSDALLPIERGKGLNAISTLLDRPTPINTFATSQTRKLHSAAQRTLLISQSLSLLALSSRILSSAFRPLLLNSLYTVLSHLASPQTIVREHATISLAHIAFHTGYASPRNLIIDNVDYVINVVSRRLSPARLSIHAPLVLIAMIKLVGSEIVPLVHDVVDEIFDALDDYHGYETLASSLLAVLVCLIQVMSDDVKSEGLSEERRKKMEELRRVDISPDPVENFGKFQKWYNERKEMRDREVEDILERAPNQDWSKLGKNRMDDNGGGESLLDADPDEPEEKQRADDTEPPLTRSQEVCKQILTKSIYFLSHSNPFLRSRVLDLISSSVPVLANGNREGDLLPLIDGAWGIIITRLNDSEGYVVTAAAEVIAKLAEYTGDYMGRRILDHAWPKFQSLLLAQKVKDQHSALVSRSAAGGGVQSSHTTSHRLHMAILCAMKWVAEEVPVDDSVIWGMAVAFRPFLDKRANVEVQNLAREVYEGLGRRDEDLVWVVLSNTVNVEGGEGVWGYLKEPGLDIVDNVGYILAAAD